MVEPVFLELEYAEASVSVSCNRVEGHSRDLSARTRRSAEWQVAVLVSPSHRARCCGRVVRDANAREEHVPDLVAAVQAVEEHGPWLDMDVACRVVVPGLHDHAL